MLHNYQGACDCISYSKCFKMNIRAAETRSNKMLSWVFMLISVVIIIQPFSFLNVSACNQQNSSLAIDIKPDTFHILLLFSFPESKILYQYHRKAL